MSLNLRGQSGPLVGFPRLVAAVAQKARKKKTKDGAEDIPLEQLRVEMMASATQLIVGFKKVHRGKKLAAVEDADWFVGLQLITFTRMRNHLLNKSLSMRRNVRIFWDARRRINSTCRAERLSGGQAERLGRDPAGMFRAACATGEIAGYRRGCVYDPISL